MRAILKPIGPSKSKPISGEVVQDGIGRITLIVNGKGGVSRIRGFEKSKYIITYY